MPWNALKFKKECLIGEYQPPFLLSNVVQATLNDPEVESYVKKNKLKLNSEQNLKQLLAYYTDVILVEKSASDPVASIKK